MFIDSHAHLTNSAFDSDRTTVIQNARAAGAVAIVSVSTDEVDTAHDRRLAAEFPGFIYSTAGVHPHEAGRYDAARDRVWIREAVAAGAVAIGECGLDYHYDHSPRAQQRTAFLDQIALARELGRPVIVHNRESDADMQAIVRSAGESGVRGVLHSFSGSPALADAALAAGWYLSFSGMVTFTRWDAEEIARAVPDDRLLVETDAPYLAPVPMRGQRNEPRFVPHILVRLAAVRGTTPDALGTTVTTNARRLFSLPEPTP